MDPIVWAALLLLFGFLLAVLEMFVPSGGVFGFLSITAIVGSVAMAFYVGSFSAGISFVIVTGVAIPIVVGLGFKYWPRTPFGRRLLLEAPRPDEVKQDDRGLKALLGKFGVAKSVMLPSGPVEIEGRTYDAVSEGMAIEKGETIKVVEIRANRMVVRPDSGKPTEAKSIPRDDVLNRGIDELGLEDPLA